MLFVLLAIICIKIVWKEFEIMKFFSRLFQAFLVASLATLLAAVPQTTSAGVKIKSKTSYYSVKGRDGKELNLNMLKEGRKRIPLAHAIAATQYSFDFDKPKVAVKGRKCVIDDVNVVLEIEYIFPRWTDKNRASSEMRRNWDKFYSELKRHEAKHGEIAMKGAKALEREFRKINGNTFIGCKDMGSFAAFRLKNVVRKTRAEQKAFDRREYARSSRISKLQRSLYKSN